MQITAIKQQVKRADRYSVYVDGKYVFSLSENELIGSGLRLRQEVTDEQLRDFKEQSALGKAYDRALNLISHRPRSERELRDYLRRKELDPSAIDAVIVRLTERGYVNDLDFAQRWVATRRLLKLTSQRRLRAELQQKGVASDIIAQVLAEDETDQSEVLRDLVARKRQQTKYQDDLKLMQYLSRQGFNYDEIKTALNVED